MQIAVFGRSIEEQWRHKLYQVIDFFTCRGVSLVWYEPFYRFLKAQSNCPLFPSVTFTQLPDGCGMLLNLGGDGTFLESLVFSKERSIPVAGINFGRLGFFFFWDQNQTTVVWNV